MKRKGLVTIFFIFASVLCVGAQDGGKAEPKRIEFAAGKSSILLAGRLRNGQEMEYVFAARKGQKVTVRNNRTSLFDFRIFNSEFDFETEYDSSPVYSFELPDAGDYLFFVRRKLTKAKAASFSVSLSIK
jgi:hypothetical protein